MGDIGSFYHVGSAFLCISFNYFFILSQTKVFHQIGLPLFGFLKKVLIIHLVLSSVFLWAPFLSDFLQYDGASR